MQIEKIGTASERQFVLVHGWGINSGVMLPFAEKLAEFAEVILLDLPGYGRNSNLQFPQDEETLIEMVAAVTDKPAYWVGWSFGATVALKIAEKKPQQVKGLISIAGTPKFVNKDGEWSYGVDAAIAAEFAENLAQNSSKTLKIFEAQTAAQESDARVLLKMIRSARKDLPITDTLIRSLNMLHNADMRAAVAEMDIPAFWVFGEHDALIRPIPKTQLINANQKSVTAIIPQTGHMPFLSATEETVQRIKEFTGTE